MAATIKDIARETGLGLATISSYLNGGNVREKNRIKIEQAIDKLDFEVNEVARGLKTDRTKMIGIVIPELNNIFCAEIITEAEDVLRSHGYATMICDCRTDEKREEEAIAFFKHRRVDGLMIMPTEHSGVHIREFAKTGKPVVLIDRKVSGIECDCVLVDNEGAAADAVNRLREAGHEKIGMIAGPRGVYTADERLGGYGKAMGIADPGKSPLVVRGDFTIRGGRAAARRLVEENPDMTALFVSNYEMTVGAVIELNEMGISIPDRLSLIGFDNEEFARASVPRLSIVTQPTQEIGQKAVELMLGRLDTKETGKREEEETARQTIRLKTSFITGRSVKNIKAAFR